MADRFSLSGKTALVTGASRGIGAAIAVGLAQAGASVAAHGHSRSAHDTCLRIGDRGSRALELRGDLADPAVPERLVRETIEAFGRLDVLVNNAGIVRAGRSETFSDDDWHAQLRVNLDAAFRASRAAARHLLERGSGKILNVASLLSFQGGLEVAAYAASKGALAQLTKALSNEWAGRGVNVNALAPGYVRTDNTAPLLADETRFRQITERIPAGRWGEPEDLVGAAVYLCSPAADYVHGHLLVVDGGWLAR